MRRICCQSIWPLLLLAHTLGAAEPLDISPAAVEARLLNDVAYLAADELEGRGVRTRGIDLAADFIAREFAAAGLNTTNYQGTPFHEFTVYSPGSSGAVQSLTWEQGDSVRKLTVGDDFTSLMFTASGNFRLPLAFVGYGISDARRGYDDYAGVDVDGHAVIMLRQEPQSRQSDSIFDGVEPTDHAYLLTKIRNAIRHGAAAIVLVSDQASLSTTVVGDVQEPIDRLLESELTATLGSESIPVVHCKRKVVEDWLSRIEGFQLSQVETEIDAILRPRSRLLPGQFLDGKVALTRPGRKLRNVVASLNGDGPASEEAIIVGAHYDHLGRGGWGSLASGANEEIHNGADDNASGTAVLLEAARQLASAGGPRNRKIVFVAFTGEELGLYGSKRYVQDPLVPLTQSVAMLNLDMVGRLRQDRLTVYGVGTADEWPTLLEQSAAGPKLKLRGEPSGFGPSDHAPFHERGIPVLHFFTGFHAEYHRPPDDVALLNISGMQRITELLVDLIGRIDQAPRRPRATTGEQPLQLADGIGLVGLGAITTPAPRRQLGVVLQVKAGEPGLEIQRVQPGSMAERLGLLPSDVLLRIDGQALQSRADLSACLQRAEFGDTLHIEFDRGGILREIRVRF